MAEKKKINPWVFMIVATLFNMALCLVLFIVFIVLISLLSRAVGLSESVYSYMILGSLVLDFVITFLIYKKVTKWAETKWDLESSFSRRKKLY